MIILDAGDVNVSKRGWSERANKDGCVREREIDRRAEERNAKK